MKATEEIDSGRVTRRSSIPAEGARETVSQEKPRKGSFFRSSCLLLTPVTSGTKDESERARGIRKSNEG